MLILGLQRIIKCFCYRNDEIVMPSEHGGLIRENYLWKVLLRKGASKEGEYFHIPPGKVKK